MGTYKYQICVLGNATSVIDEVKEFLIKQVGDLGLDPDHLEFFDRQTIHNRERKAPCAAIFFGYDGANAVVHEELDPLIEDSLLIVPVVDRIENYTQLTPKNLRNYNGIPSRNGVKAASTRILEHFRLLRSERRLFISYKRDESSSIALQLYYAFDKHGYDVFLDTRSVRGGAMFQDVLWHRMADSDVVVLLDSPTFHESKWTRAEYARALASKIHIQHLLWPGVAPQSEEAFDEFWDLVADDFASSTITGDGAVLTENCIEDIVRSTEECRARALAARNTDLIDGFCDMARNAGHNADLQPGLSIDLKANGRDIAVIPMVGVPNAARLHDILNRSLLQSPKAEVWALYEDCGILESVIDHLVWLNDNLPITAVPKAISRNMIKGL